MKHLCYLSLGSNLGNKLENLTIALNKIKTSVGDIVLQSSVYESEPWGYADSENYFNMAIKVASHMKLHDMLTRCLEIETEMGRKRTKPSYEPRIIDIDILFYDEVIIQTPEIVVPHPRLQIRKFVLEPLCEIEPDFIHPVFKKTPCELLEECMDTSEVTKIKF